MVGSMAYTLVVQKLISAVDYFHHFILRELQSSRFIPINYLSANQNLQAIGFLVFVKALFRAGFVS